MAVKIAYHCLNFGKVAAKDQILEGDMVKNEMVDGALKEICLLSDLDIPDLENDEFAY